MSYIYIATVSTHTYIHIHTSWHMLKWLLSWHTVTEARTSPGTEEGTTQGGEEGGPFATRQPRNCKDKNGRWTRSVSYSAGQLWKKIMITGTHIILWLPNNLKLKLTLYKITRTNTFLYGYLIFPISSQYHNKYNGTVYRQHFKQMYCNTFYSLSH